MANPNIVNVANIYGDNNSVSLTTTSATQLISNPAGSGKVMKVGTIIAANVGSNSSTTITVNLYSAAALGGTAFPIAYGVGVPVGASLVALDKASPIYLKENQSIGVTANIANQLVVTASWEEIS
jgi:hypothetical protein